MNNRRALLLPFQSLLEVFDLTLLLDYDGEDTLTGVMLSTCLGEAERVVSVGSW